MICGKNSPNAFYSNAFELLNSPQGFLKICGITSKEDALMCANTLESTLQNHTPNDSSPKKLAALGFILAKDSPRFITPQAIEEISNALKSHPKILKIGVVKEDEKMLQQAINLYKQGIIDALQLHGVKQQNFAKIDLKNADFSFYEVWNIAESEDLGDFISPFVLLDSKSQLGEEVGKALN